jgi:2-desacetyl-2-hydroxyethyl bacteriochlorophyllide A dehydrogenase
MTEARALWFSKPLSVELRPEPLREPRAGEVVVRGVASCVSQGTELLLYRGEGPTPFDPSLDPPGAPTYPRRYGYAWVGEVEARGDGVAVPVGTRVFALAPHGEAHVLDAKSVRVLADDVPEVRATLAASMETALTCAWDAEPSLGESAVVLGGGAIGMLVAWLLDRAGARVTLVEPGEKRRDVASALVPSANVVAPSRAMPSADVVVEATGRPAALDDAIAWCRAEARVVVASFYGKRRAEIDLGGAFHRKRLSLVASQVSSIPPRLRGRWDAARRWTQVVDLLRDDALDGLIAEPVPFAKAPELYGALSEASDVPPAHVFVYR